MSAYAELAAATNFSFLRGASHPQDMVMTALLLGYAGLGVADRNSVAGVVRAWSALKDLQEHGLPPPEKVRQGGGPGEYAYVEGVVEGDIDSEEVRARAADFRLAVGARLVFMDGAPDIIAYPESRLGWARLCQLLTLGARRAKKGDCDLILDDLLQDTAGLLLVVMPGRDLGGMGGALRRIARRAPGAVWLGAAMHRRGDDRRQLVRLQSAANDADIPLLAVNDALYHAPEARDLQDVLTCIREGVTIETAGRLLEVNAERHLKPIQEMERLFRDAPDAIAQTQALLQRIDFDLGQLRYEYPEEPIPPGRTPQEYLEELTWRRAQWRYPEGVPEAVEEVLKDELRLIEKLDYAPYFLTIYDIVRVAEDKGILCQGRGSAANSAVCYALGITAVDPAAHDLLFARFISEERREPPDIDVDFEHERREEIIQHIYERYGRHRAGIAATVIRYRPKSAIREAGKVLGLTEDITSRLAGTVWGSWSSGLPQKHIRQAGLDPENPTILRAVSFACRMLGFPRHLSQHVGGFILTRDRLDALVPVQNAAMADRTFIEWDKDDIDALGLMKVDVLALGMLTCIRKAFDLLESHDGMKYGLADIPREDPVVYEMLQKGDSLGVFQVESRAQMNMLPRLRPKTFYDLVIQVAIVRPGPIQGDMVHPYLRRRNGQEEVRFPAPSPEHGPPDELYQVLNRTKGVPLFQEQAMRLAMVAARFTDTEANQLRRAMATFRSDGKIHTFEELLVGRMVERGYEREFAERCFEQIKGFGSYGFPESHAASFAKLVYVSSWIKCWHPAVFACALLNSQPMGFYAPAQIVRDAREHDVEVRPVDINHSFYDNTLERSDDGALALRLGFRQVDGMAEAAADVITRYREEGYGEIEEVCRRSGVPAHVMRRLADADAFRSMGLDRREALWAVRRLPDDDPLPLFQINDAPERGDDIDMRLPTMPLREHVAADYQTMRLSLKAHPMEILRPVFERQGIATCEQAANRRDGAWTRNAGVVLIRQRPGNGKAIFITLEDETGVTNVVLWARTFERFRREVMSARVMLVEGRMQKSPEGVVHLMGVRVFDRSAELVRLSEDHDVTTQRSRADEFDHPQYPRDTARHPRNVRVLPKSRDFH